MLVGGHDVRALELGWLRRQVAVVSQDVFLFHGSVRDNILFGRPDADDREMHAAARAANAEEFIRDLPDGYDTVVGDRGVRLSGGQRQRVAIARALLKDAPILILDEATSSVDAETEALIQEAMGRLLAGRTALVIAHRRSTIERADRVVVLEAGRVIEDGTPPTCSPTAAATAAWWRRSWERHCAAPRQRAWPADEDFWTEVALAMPPRRVA